MSSDIAATSSLVQVRAGAARLRPWASGSSVALQLALPVLLFLLWQVAATQHWMSPQVLPTPSAVWDTAGELWSDNLLANLAISLRRLAIGFASAAGLGIALGGAMGMSRRLEAIVYPTFIALVQVPTLAWIPLLMMLLGLGEALKIVVIIKAIVTPVAIYAHLGVRDLDPRLIEAARVLRLKGRVRLLRVVAPSALPSVLTGLRLGMVQGWTSLVAVELLASSEGIGFLMVWGRQLFQLDVVFVCIAVIGLIGFAMDRGLDRVDRALVRWPRPPLAPHWSGTQGPRGLTAVLPLLLLAAWSAASAGALVDPRLWPAPVAVLRAAWEGLADGSFVGAMGLSLMRAFSGVLIGGAIGLVVGVSMGLLQPLHTILNGTLAALRTVAIFAWIPLLTAWVGLGEAAKVSFVAIASFFPMQLAASRGVAGLPPQLIEAGRVLRLPPLTGLRRLVLPGIAPAAFAGLRLALLQCWIGTMGAEYFMPSGGGIGSLMIGAEQLLRTDRVLAAMILIGIVAASLNWLGARFEARATRWRRI